MPTLTEMELLRELEPAVAANLNRHLATTEEWRPHEWLPWSRGRDFAGDAGVAWSEEQGTEVRARNPYGGAEQVVASGLPPDPVAAAVTRPYWSTVMFALV